MTPGRQNFIVTYGWARQTTYRILAWSQAPHSPTIFPQLFSTRVMLCSSLLLVLLCLDSIASGSKMSFLSMHLIFQTLDLVVNYPLPLLTFIFTSYQLYVTNSRIKYFTWVHSVMSEIKIPVFLTITSRAPSSHAIKLFSIQILKCGFLKWLNVATNGQTVLFFVNPATWIPWLKLLTFSFALTNSEPSSMLSSHFDLSALFLLLGYSICWSHQTWIIRGLCCPTTTWLWVFAWQPSCSSLIGFLAPVLQRQIQS